MSSLFLDKKYVTFAETWRRLLAIVGFLVFGDVHLFATHFKY